ncbi:MAG: hypothetical protein JSR87_07290 [Proteobacteria bacterium]|nr:hypothetical protein [Pseudomonadota bacterium]MBS0572164.1 hypothetical protein [Pseudomonadota bacterium]
MMHRLLPLVILLLPLAAAARADCTVHYKAKRGNPMQLEAGTASLPEAACASRAAAAAALAPMLAGQGWTLLAITAIIPGS